METEELSYELRRWQPIVGKTIAAVRRNEAKDLLELDTDLTELGGSPIFISATGDCCSSSWFEHISGIEALLGQVVLRVVNRPMPTDLIDAKDEHGEHRECLSYYGWTLETARGRCDIEMRNSSNGYYGGDVEIAEKPLDQYGSRRDARATIPVTEDF